MTSRAERLLSLADCEDECGLEIGPLDKPLVKRHPGRRIFYCDYASRDELRRKSSDDPNVNIDLIPEIDFVSPKISADTFGGMRFDYILASHVIEHVPNMIGWLKHLLSALTQNGRIILAIPDRRYTFDYIRPLSTVGQLVESYLAKRSIPTFSQVYDGFSKAVRADTLKCWTNSEYPDLLEPYFTKNLALRLADDAFQNGTYHDCHCWVFTYSSFVEIINEINELGILNVQILAKFEPQPDTNEFHIILGNAAVSQVAQKYEGKIVYQPSANRGKDDGWYLVKDGKRRWITDSAWLAKNGYKASEVIEISSIDFDSIPEDSQPLK